MTGTFTAGAVLTAANLNSSINTFTTNAQSGAGYTLVLADAGKLVTVSNGSAQNLTIPLNSSVAFPTGTTIDVLNIGAGTWTVTATGGVTLNGTTPVPTSGQVRLIKTGTDTWYSSAMGAAVGGGFTLITSQSFTASSAVNVNNCFTSAFDNYRVILTGQASASPTAIRLRMRLSGTDNSAATYSTRRQYNGTGSNPDVSATSAGVVEWYPVDTHILTVDVTSPALVRNTGWTANGMTLVTASNPQDWISWGVHATATAFDGFTVFPSTGNMTGSVRVYGYR